MASQLSSSHFELFGLSPAFSLDTTELTRKYRELQQAVHPDRFASAPEHERRWSMQRAAQINEAYQVLKDPLARARYLLALRGVSWDDEQDTVVDTAFLMQQMEHRETLAEAREQSDPLGTVGQVLDEVSRSIKGMTGDLERLFASNSDDALAEARVMVRRLQFLYKLRQEAEETEADLEDQV